MPARSPNGGLQRLRQLARSRSRSQPGVVILRYLAQRTKTAGRRRPLDYARAYFRNKVLAPFVSPLASDFDLVIEQPLTLDFYTDSGPDLVAAIEYRLQDYALYLSRYLNRPRYAAEAQVGFVRGDTLRPVGIRESATTPGLYTFKIAGLAVGRGDMLRFLRGENVQGPKPPRMDPPPQGWMRFFFFMPSRTDAREVDRTDWYHFTPDWWRRRHPSIPLLPPIPVLIHRRDTVAALAPQYDRLYADGRIRIAFLFGYDEEGHNAEEDARQIYQIITAPPSRRFATADMGPTGYHGPGLGFSDPTGGRFDRLNLDGTSVFRRDATTRYGPVAVRYQLRNGGLRVGTASAPEGNVFVNGKPVRAGTTVPAGTVVTRSVNAEIRLFNFDKAAPRTSSAGLIERFVSVFRDHDFIHYDGHANYGGGFYIGDQPDDILWADDIGSYAEDFSPGYQIFSIGACHAAGYFADLFYNELAPRKSVKNLDIVAAVNETVFDDAVQVGAELIRFLLQQGTGIGTDPPDYARILRTISRPASFHAYTGVFAAPVAAI